RPAGRATIAPRSVKQERPAAAERAPGELQLRMRTIEGEAPTEYLYERLFADSNPSFWFDSADAPTWLAQCSYMGTTAGAERCFADIAKSQAELAAGESYEVCLTDQFSTDASPEPFDLYRQLRRSNASPFSAFLQRGENTIVSSSPERFISVDRQRQVMARP